MMKFDDSACGWPLALTASAAETTTVFRAGDSGYASIRIPALLTAQDGTLLAFAEGREVARDQAANDIVLRRSTDGGRTWLPLQKLADFGKDALNNPCPVLDVRTGRLTLFFQRYPSSVHEYGKMEADCVSSNTVRSLRHDQRRPRRDVERAARHHLRGQATGAASRPWPAAPGSAFRSSAVRTPGGWSFRSTRGPPTAGGSTRPTATTPARPGAMARPRRAACSPTRRARWRATVNEVQMIERADGSLLLNTRSQTGPRQRRQAVSTDGGATWGPLRHWCPSCSMRRAWPARSRWTRAACCCSAGPRRAGGRTVGSSCLTTAATPGSPARRCSRAPSPTAA
jgi:sialidase-1